MTTICSQLKGDILLPAGALADERGRKKILFLSAYALTLTQRNLTVTSVTFYFFKVLHFETSSLTPSGAR